MQKKILQIFIVFMAAIVGYASSGVNVYKYCCDACKDYGITNFFDYQSCEDVHDTHACQCASDPLVCNDKAATEINTGTCYTINDDCSIVRLETEAFISMIESVSFDIPVCDLPFMVEFPIKTSLYEVPNTSSHFDYQHHKPSSREMLCLKSTLTI